MRLTDRLNLPQRIVVVVALGLALGEIGNYFLSLDAAITFGWSAYPATAPAGYSPALSTWLPGWAHLVIWMALIILWVLLSLQILRPSPETTPDD